MNSSVATATMFHSSAAKHYLLPDISLRLFFMLTNFKLKVFAVLSALRLSSIQWFYEYQINET